MKRSTRILMALFILLCLSPIIYLAVANAIGYCRDEHRILNDSQILRVVFQQLNSRYEFIPYRESGLKTIVPYKNFEDFVKQNPNCCTVGVKNIVGDKKDGVSLPFSWRITDDYYDSLLIEYKIRYQDGAGKIKTKTSKEFYHVTSCGIIIL